MIIPLLLTTTIILGMFSTTLEKKFQLSVKNNLPTMVMMNLVNSLFGSISFFLMCKFKIRMNFTTFAFAFGYAMLVFNSLVISLIALSKMSIPVKTIVGMLGSVLGSVFAGRIFFGEKITFNSVLAVVFLLTAVILPYIKNNEVRAGKHSAPVCIWLFLTCATSSVYLKFYTEHPKTLEANNLFFMTNLICLIICAIAVIIYLVVEDKQVRKRVLTEFSPKHIANIGVRTVMSNITSIITVFIIAAMDISVYTVLSSSLGLISSVLISKFLFLEDLTWKNYVSVALAIASVVVQIL